MSMRIRKKYILTYMLQFDHTIYLQSVLDLPKLCNMKTYLSSNQFISIQTGPCNYILVCRPKEDSTISNKSFVNERAEGNRQVAQLFSLAAVAVNSHNTSRKMYGTHDPHASRYWGLEIFPKEEGYLTEPWPALDPGVRICEMVHRGLLQVEDPTIALQGLYHLLDVG